MAPSRYRAHRQHAAPPLRMRLELRLVRLVAAFVVLTVTTLRAADTDAGLAAFQLESVTWVCAVPPSHSIFALASVQLAGHFTLPCSADGYRCIVVTRATTDLGEELVGGQTPRANGDRPTTAGITLSSPRFGTAEIRLTGYVAVCASACPSQVIDITPMQASWNRWLHIDGDPASVVRIIDPSSAAGIDPGLSPEHQQAQLALRREQPGNYFLLEESPAFMRRCVNTLHLDQFRPQGGQMDLELMGISGDHCYLGLHAWLDPQSGLRLVVKDPTAAVRVPFTMTVPLIRPQERLAEPLTFRIGFGGSRSLPPSRAPGEPQAILALTPLPAAAMATPPPASIIIHGDGLSGRRRFALPTGAVDDELVIRAAIDIEDPTVLAYDWPSIRTATTDAGEALPILSCDPPAGTPDVLPVFSDEQRARGVQRHEPWLGYQVAVTTRTPTRPASEFPHLEFLLPVLRSVGLLQGASIPLGAVTTDWTWYGIPGAADRALRLRLFTARGGPSIQIEPTLGMIPLLRQATLVSAAGHLLAALPNIGDTPYSAYRLLTCILPVPLPKDARIKIVLAPTTAHQVLTLTLDHDSLALWSSAAPIPPIGVESAGSEARSPRPLTVPDAVPAPAATPPKRGDF